MTPNNLHIVVFRLHNIGFTRGRIINQQSKRVNTCIYLSVYEEMPKRAASVLSLAVFAIIALTYDPSKGRDSLVLY